MAIQPITGFDLGALIDAGLAADSASEWHEPDGYWHASALARCPRRNVLWQAGLATDGTPRSGGMNFALGHAIHERLEGWAENYASIEPRFEIVNIEGIDYATKQFVNGKLDDIRLKARNDMLIRWEGELVLFEIKSERSECPICKRGGAKFFRVQDMRKHNLPAPVKWEHIIQGSATAMVYEPHYGPIKQARALYWGKNDYLIDQVPFSVSDEAARNWVRERCLYLTGAYLEFKEKGSLPPRIVPGSGDDWECRARGDRDAQCDADRLKGLYCPARSVCMASNA